jgi:hypothetical protein
MKNCNAPENQITRHLPLIACATALTVAITVSLPQLARADRLTPPRVPSNIEVPAANKAFLEDHAVGTQTISAYPPQFLASPGHSLGHRPPCSTRTISRSLATSSAPTRLRIDTPRATWQHSRTLAPSAADHANSLRSCVPAAIGGA